MTAEASGALDLRSFLNDFVIDMGPLGPEVSDCNGSDDDDEMELLDSGDPPEPSTTVFSSA